MDTNHPDMAEGQLAKLRAAVVNMRALASVARGLGLGDYPRILLQHFQSFTCWGNPAQAAEVRAGWSTDDPPEYPGRGVKPANIPAP